MKRRTLAGVMTLAILALDRSAPQPELPPPVTLSQPSELLLSHPDADVFWHRGIRLRLEAELAARNVLANDLAGLDRLK